MRCLVTILTLISLTTGLPHGRIYGGTDAAPGQFPFIAVFTRPEQFCDGVIIDKNWILTAAHCVDDFTPDSTILVGTITIHTGGTRYNISKAIQHEEYDAATSQNDIALVKIDGEFIFSDLVTTIEVGDNEINETCTAIGFGTTQDEELPENLKFVELPTIELDYCKTFSIVGVYLTSAEVCTLAEEGKGLCNRDSGGPLVCKEKLVGLVSFGMKPCAQGYPDVFTKPIFYEDWIQEKIVNE